MRFVVTIAIFALGLATVAAMAQMTGSSTVFDMKGTWKGTRPSITDGVTPHQPASAQKGSAGPYRLTDLSVTYKVEGQEGQRFWGTMSSDNFTNRLIGSQSMDGKRLYMVGAQGTIDAQPIDADTIEVCYRHANATSATVGCNVMKRQK